MLIAVLSPRISSGSPGRIRTFRVAEPQTSLSQHKDAPENHLDLVEVDGIERRDRPDQPFDRYCSDELALRVTRYRQHTTQLDVCGVPTPGPGHRKDNRDAVSIQQVVGYDDSRAPKSRLVTDRIAESCLARPMSVPAI